MVNHLLGKIRHLAVLTQFQLFLATSEEGSLLFYDLQKHRIMRRVSSNHFQSSLVLEALPKKVPENA